ncbi:serpin family protein [Planococcus chinensis]|uniref:Serpin family protein n=1 Tax=Planococcus chinensis TaxID=272917 RepID=A0ABW4QG57_9BACL
MKKIAKLFILLTLLIVSACGSSSSNGNPGMAIADGVEYSKHDYEKISGPINRLGFRLMDDLSQTEDGNKFISPLSLYMALSMVYNGAAGPTKDELANVLGAEGISPEEMNRANASLSMQFADRPEGIELNIANSIWAKEEYRFLDSFSKSSRDYYNAQIEEIDISDPASADRINEWVSDATNGKIKKMAAKPLSPNLAAMLLNAIYFKGDWQYPFPEGETTEQPFTRIDGSTTDVPLMNLQSRLPYLKTDDFQAVSLPYGDGEMSMNIFLPAPGTELDELASGLTEEKWNQWMKGFEPKDGTLMIPKFKMEYEVILNEALSRLGMETAFRSADLSNMFETSSGLYISEVKQKTFIDVNEKGTEAAAATSVSIAESESADSFRMIANRPFIFTITDSETGVILFMGRVENPAS